MAHDLLICGGTVVDGTGADARAADVVIDGGRIGAVVEPGTAGDATETIDARGLLVTFGFVDIHTHFDGQATWDDELAPSSWHGVGTRIIQRAQGYVATIKRGVVTYRDGQSTGARPGLLLRG